MQKTNDFLARGKVIEQGDRTITFHPVGTSYHLRLDVVDHQVAASDSPVAGIIRVRARKLWTVSSGGLFIAPIVGPPRIIQGRVRQMDEGQLVVNAGTNIHVDLPDSGDAFDLSNGMIAVGRMVNVTALPGAWFEPVNR